MAGRSPAPGTLRRVWDGLHRRARGPEKGPELPESERTSAHLSDPKDLQIDLLARRSSALLIRRAGFESQAAYCSYVAPPDCSLIWPRWETRVRDTWMGALSGCGRRGWWRVGVVGWFWGGWCSWFACWVWCSAQRARGRRRPCMPTRTGRVRRPGVRRRARLRRGARCRRRWGSLRRGIR